ncbi:MAG: hypothetical protein R3B82_02195 [Sandaracinaceae bacterium]
MRPPPLPHQLDVLERVLSKLESWSADVPPVVTFDLDATLFDNRPRTLEILHELREEISDEDPEIANLLLALELDKVHYLLTDTLKACNIYRADVVKNITQYWHERFFRDEYIACDVPSKEPLKFGCRTTAQECHEGRRHRLRDRPRHPRDVVGTVAKLRDEGFPIAVAGTELDPLASTSTCRRLLLRSALPTSRVGEVAAFFDNEPANCNLAKSIFPGATVAVRDAEGGVCRWPQTASR